MILTFFKVLEQNENYQLTVLKHIQKHHKLYMVLLLIF